jgi:hypothetical protein
VRIYELTLASLLIALAGAADGPSSAASSSRAVVIAELFTSEGCSSCPPADDLLRQLVEQQPVPGVEVVALSEHVNYWDNLGWRDPFSSVLMTERQSQYARPLNVRAIYTPQLIVDGRLEYVGSNGLDVRRALTAAAKLPKADVAVAGDLQGDGHVQIRVRIGLPVSLASHDDADVMVAITEDRILSSVNRGENKGKALRHAAVTRLLTSAGRLKRHELVLSTDVLLPASDEWKPANLHAIAFVQERLSRHILGGGINNIH